MQGWAVAWDRLLISPVRIRVLFIALILVVLFLFTKIGQLQNDRYKSATCCACKPTHFVNGEIDLDDPEQEEPVDLEQPKEELPPEIDEPTPELDAQSQSTTSASTTATLSVEALTTGAPASTEGVPAAALPLYNQLQQSIEAFPPRRNLTAILRDVKNNEFATVDFYRLSKANFKPCTELAQVGGRLWQKWRKLVLAYDFTSSQLPIKSFMDLLQLTVARHVPYRLFVSNDCPQRIRAEVSTTPRDLNVLIPVFGRMRNVKLCLDYLLAAASQVSDTLTIKITVIEIADKPKIEPVVADLSNVDYIFLPKSIANISGSGPHFAKALGYNFGFKLTAPALWTLFHDIDILVPQTFFKSFSNRYKSYKRPWFFPYTVLMLLTEEATAALLQDYEKGEPKRLFNYTSQRSAGSNPGGSIFIRSDIFVEVGGYDPELFWGWAPEDQFMMRKLMYYTDYFWRDDKLVLYHLHHPTSIEHRYDTLFHGISHYFNSTTLWDKYFFFQFKKHLFLN